MFIPCMRGSHTAVYSQLDLYKAYNLYAFTLAHCLPAEVLTTFLLVMSSTRQWMTLKRTNQQQVVLPA